MPHETASAKLLVDFANTYVVDRQDGDLINTPGALQAWLADQGLLPREAKLNDADVNLALALRQGLRTAMTAHHETSAPALSELDAIAARLPLRVSFDASEPRMVPMGDGVERALAAVLVAVQESVGEGTWPRLKLCRSDTCQWAFLDESKNQRRSWCSMAVCGNREKTRAYRLRQHAQV